MRDMKFDVDIILRNCEHFDVKVEKGENLHGVTMNGNPFDVTDEMDKALVDLKRNNLSECGKTIFECNMCPFRNGCKQRKEV